MIQYKNISKRRRELLRDQNTQKITLKYTQTFGGLIISEMGFLAEEKIFLERENEQEPRTHTSKWYQVP